MIFFFFWKRQDCSYIFFFLLQILLSVNIFSMQLQEQWVGCAGQEVAGGWDSGRNMNEVVSDDSVALAGVCVFDRPRKLG